MKVNELLNKLTSKQGKVVQTAFGTYRLGKVTERGSVLLHSVSEDDTSTQLIDIKEVENLGII